MNFLQQANTDIRVEVMEKVRQQYHIVGAAEIHVKSAARQLIAA